MPRGKVGTPSSVGVGEGSGAVSPVRKKPINKSQEELEEEAARVLQQVDEVDCVVAGNGLSPSRFYTLPTRKKKTYEYPSLDRRTLHRGSQELLPPKKPPRTFAAAPKSSIFDIFKRDKRTEPKKSNLRRSVSDVSSQKSKVNVKLFGNDTDTKKQLSPIIEVTPREDYFDPLVEGNREDDEIDVKAPARKKKRQSITEKLKQFIDEVDEELYKETGVRPLPTDEPKEAKEPQPIIIDVDKAEKISGRKKKFKASLLGKKFKVGKSKKNKTNEAAKLKKTILEKPEPAKKTEEETLDKRTAECLPSTPSPRIKEAIETLEHSNTSPAMIHSSQKPVDKLPLTKGRTVDPMVQRLSRDAGSSPPSKPNVMVAPHASVQHNNNQPFSYTRGLSPEKYNENVQSPGSPIIYAQVVCGNNSTGPKKQTIHTAYTNGKKHPHSDSDEGLGGEEHRRSHDYYDEGDKFEEESPITPKFRNPAFINGYTSFERKEFGQNGYIERGRGDGMDAKRRESLTEQMDNDFPTKHQMANGRTDLSARRDLLESRIARRVNDSVIRTSPVTNTVYITESTSKYYRERSTSPVGYSKKYSPDPKPDRYSKPTTTDARNKKYYGETSHRYEYDNNRTKSNGYTYNGFDSEPKSFDSQISDYRSSPENRHFDASPRYNPKIEKKTLYKDRAMYKSTPEIHLRSYQDQNLSDSYHDSLRREKMESRMTSSSKYRSERFLDESERKEKFVDSGIENDFRRDSGDNFRVTRPPRRKEQYCNESEDEGFASSLLIASEKQHTEENASQKKRRDYDSDRTYSREDDPYRHLEAMEYKSKFRSNEYIPRERSIDDGSHYDPRIDKDEDRSTLKRVDTKPHKPEKKSGLEKVKSLFTRKKDKQLPGLVSQDSLRARYVEYKGRESVEPKYKKKEVNDVHLVSHLWIISL
nr:unnamed protein product [Callosobruchus chinensis]